MRFGAFTMMTDPVHREDPWAEWIAQAVMCFEKVAVVYGREQDGDMIQAKFGEAILEGRLLLRYMHWPQPEWSYEELPKHLNAALQMMRDAGMDWAIRLDCDTTIHQNDIVRLGAELRGLDNHGYWLGRIEKKQFFLPEKAYLKGKMPVCVNLHKPIMYGFNLGKYTDLCQPIRWDGKTTAVLAIAGKQTDTKIPAGRAIIDDLCRDVAGVYLWNYDYTYKTEKRARELLYQFERAHERFWNHGYTGKSGNDITEQTAFDDFMGLARGRYSKMNLKYVIGDHPMHFQDSLRELSNPQFGHSLWGKIVV